MIIALKKDSGPHVVRGKDLCPKGVSYLSHPHQAIGQSAGFTFNSFMPASL